MITKTACLALLLAAPAVAQTNFGWQTVGSPGFSDWATVCTRIAADNTGNVYVAYQDLFPGLGARVTVKKLVGDAWQTIGGNGGASTGAGYYCNMAFDAQNRLLVACRDYGLLGHAGVRRFDAATNTWSPLGGTIGTGEAHYVDLAVAPDGRALVAYADEAFGARTTAVRLDSGSWSTLGSPGFSTAVASFQKITIAPNGTIYSAFSDGSYPDSSSVGKASVERFDPATSTWSFVGAPGFTAEGARNLTLTIDRNGVPWVAYHRFHNAIVVMRFDGTNWVAMGGSATGGDLPNVYLEEWRQWLSLQFDSQNRPYVAYQMLENGQKAAVRRLEGNAWVQLGQRGFTPGAADYLSLIVDAQDTPWVAYRDSANGQRLSVMRFGQVGQNYCSGGANSQGCLSTISCDGAPSISGTTSFVLRADNVINNSNGILVYGTQAAAIPFGNGTLCIATVQRGGMSNSGGAVGAPNCTGVLLNNFGATLLTGLPGVWIGTVMNTQFWYRDTNNPSGFALSNGLRFTVGP